MEIVQFDGIVILFSAGVTLLLIILLMSLLTSPHTTREQHKFLNKMQKEFNKHSFYNTNYIEPQHPFIQVNQNTERSQQLINSIMNQFLVNLRNIITDSINSRIDYYFVLSLMKNTDFFSEVAAIINEDQAVNNSRLEKENLKLRDQLKKSHQRIREIQRSEQPRMKSNDVRRFNGIKTISDNLYEKAKMMSPQQFTQLCNKVILGDKVVIKKINQSQSYKKWDDSKGQKLEEKQLMRRIDNYLLNRAQQNEGSMEEQLANLTQTLKDVIGQQNSNFRCKNPCCLQISEHFPTSITKASILRKSSDSRKPREIYKNDKSEQYFNRYYRRSEFDMRKIVNIEKTKLQEMQKIEDTYRINLKQRKKNFHSSLLK